MATQSKDLESQSGSNKLSHLRMVFDQARITPAVENWKYAGAGTEEEPFVVEWIENDPGNPLHWNNAKKWAVSLVMAFATLAVSFCSSAYSGGIREQMIEFNANLTIVTLGLSLFVLGFAVGPLLWAPLSEIFGRQIVFIVTFMVFTVFNAAGAGAQNIWTVIILRFIAGSFGSSPLTVRLK